MRHNPTEPVSIDMEQCQICEKAELRRQIPCNVCMVQINARYNQNGFVVRWSRTKHTSVVTDIRADPVPSYVQWVREYSFFPSLESNVGISKLRIRELEPWIDHYTFSSVPKLILAIQQLPVGNVLDIFIGQLAIKI